MELDALQEIVADIKAQGASIVVISPQLEKYSKLMIKKHNLTFPFLRDKDNQLASQFGLTFTLPDDLAELYSQFGIDLVRFNGNESKILPMPARFVLDQKGNVVSAEANPDYTHRPEPSDIVDILKKNGLMKPQRIKNRRGSEARCQRCNRSALLQSFGKEAPGVERRWRKKNAGHNDLLFQK